MFFTNLKDKPTISYISLSSNSALKSSMFFVKKYFKININYKTAFVYRILARNTEERAFASAGAF